MTDVASDIQSLVASSWRDVFEVEGVDGQADFFDLGGDSLAALEVATTLREALGSPEGLEEDMVALAILEHPVLSDFARYLEEELRR